MKILDRCSSNGEISGLQIFDRTCLLYQLFADDTCMFLRNSLEEFDRARAAIQIFENVSGAWLNVSKSVIVPLSNPLPQEWHQTTGCKVLQENESMVYLGCLIGYHVTPLQETEFLLGKVRKCLFHWVNKSLSFAGKTILLCHVIRAIPIFHFMSMTINVKDFRMLEQICRNF